VFMFYVHIKCHKRGINGSFVTSIEVKNKCTFDGTAMMTLLTVGYYYMLQRLGDL